MAYPPRVDVARATHHVTTHAVGDELLFRDALDRAKMIRLLDRVVPRVGWVVHGYCFMANHLHLAVHTPEPTLSRGMQQLLGPYARWFNERHARRGHLVERRFWSEAIESELHLYETLAYIDLNPVAVGLCATPEQHPWSGFRALAGLERAPAFLDVEATLALLGRNRDAAREAYRRLVSSRVATALARLRLSRSSRRRA